MIVVPDWLDIGNEAREVLLAYTHGGGKLLVIGAANAAMFRETLQVRFVGEASERPAHIPGDEVFANVRGLWQEVEPRGAHVLETRYPAYDATKDGKAAATMASLGDGEIAAIYGPLGAVFAQTHAPEVRVVIGRVVRAMFTPSITLEGPPSVELVRRRQDGREVLHLLNASGMQIASHYGAIDYIPPAGPLKIAIRMNHRPRRARWEPGGEEAGGDWRDGVWITQLERLAIHRMLVWES